MGAILWIIKKTFYDLAVNFYGLRFTYKGKTYHTPQMEMIGFSLMQPTIPSRDLMSEFYFQLQR